MKRKKAGWIVLIFLTLFFIPFALSAQSPDEIFQQAEEGVGYDSFLDSLPRECVCFLESAGLDLSAEGDAPGLTEIFALILNSLLSVATEYFPLLAVGLLVTVILKVVSTLSVSNNGLTESLSFLVVISSGVYSFSVVETFLGTLTRVVSQSASFLTAALPAVVSAKIWSGGEAGAGVLSVTLPVVFTAMSALVSSLFYPLCLFCFAASFCGFFRGGISLSPFVSSVKKFCSRGVEILAGLSVGVFCVQRLAVVSADTLSRRGIRFALSQLLPVAGSALTDGIETVYACGKSLCGKMGVVCVLILVTMFALPCILGFVLVTVFSLLSSAGQVLSVPLLSDFFGDVKDTFSMMTCFAVCSLVVLSAALLLLTGG